LKSFSVLTIAPQLIAGERLQDSEHALVAACLDEQLRVYDSYARIDDDSYVVMLQRATDDVALLVAHRLSRDLTARSAAVKLRIWHVGVATYPRDARTEAALIQIARRNALAQQVRANARRAS
jgi:GGDEF domain-containing protein